MAFVLLRDMGITPEFLVMLLIVLLGAAAIGAFVIGGVAVLIVGPRQMHAVTLPGVVGFVMLIAGALLVRDISLPWLATATLGAAVFVAWLQKANIDDPTAQTATSVFIVGRALVGVLTGVAVGVVAGFITSNALVLVICALVGFALGLRWGRMAEAPPERDGVPEGDQTP